MEGAGLLDVREGVGQGGGELTEGVGVDAAGFQDRFEALVNDEEGVVLGLVETEGGDGVGRGDGRERRSVAQDGEASLEDLDEACILWESIKVSRV